MTNFTPNLKYACYMYWSSIVITIRNAWNVDVMFILRFFLNGREGERERMKKLQTLVTYELQV